MKHLCQRISMPVAFTKLEQKCSRRSENCKSSKNLEIKVNSLKNFEAKLPSISKKFSSLKCKYLWELVRREQDRVAGIKISRKKISPAYVWVWARVGACVRVHTPDIDCVDPWQPAPLEEILRQTLFWRPTFKFLENIIVVVVVVVVVIVVHHFRNAEIIWLNDTGGEKISQELIKVWKKYFYF